VAKQALKIGTGENRIIIKRVGNRNRAVIWVGPPLSGIASQTEQFEKLGFPVLKMGTILKALAEQNPDGDICAAISRNELADDGMTIWQAKRWIVSKLGEPVIHLNGVPRTIPQLEIIEFMKKHGFDPMVVWFDLPNEVCLARPCRLERKAEDSQEKRMERLLVYKNKTLPMRDLMKSRFGINKSNSNLIMINNSSMEKHETGQVILDFLQLPITAKHLFPEAFIGNDQ
jgi:adenylate kinase family enzyme